MNKLSLFAALLLVASAARGAQAPPADAAAPPEPKHKLGGGFKGKEVTPKAKAPAPKPAAAPGKTPRIVIDNSRVKKSQPPGSKSETVADRGPVAPPPPAVIPKIVDLQGHDEQYWRAKAAAVRDAADKARDAVAAAETEEKREENDFYAWDDGQYRDSVIKPAWDRAREETTKAHQALDEAQKNLDSLEDEARRAGAYPGWIR